MSTEIIKIDSYDTAVEVAPVLHFVHVKNALMPSATREDRALPWREAKTVAEYLSELFPLGYACLVVSLNGRILSAIEQEHVTPRAGDWLIGSAVIEGGGVWRTLAQIGVMAAAITASVFLGPEFLALGWASSATMGTAMAAITAGLISVGGNMLINTFMGASPASKNGQPSWAFGGPQTLARPGVVIPKGYGKFASGGNIIASYIDLEGAHQYINALVCYGFGPARLIENIQINGKAISNYNNVRYFVRYGRNDQQPIPNFNHIVNGYPQSIQVRCDSGAVVVPGTGVLTQALQVDVQFPLGVYYISGAGNQLPCKIVYKVEYSLHGSGVWNTILSPKDTQDAIVYNGDGTINWSSTPTWVLLWTGGDPASGVVLQGDHSTSHKPGDVQTVSQSVTTYDATGTSHTATKSFTGEWQPIDPTVNQIKVNSWWDGYVQYVNDTTEAVYNRTSIYGLAPGKYDVRVTKWGSNNADNSVYEGDYDSPKRGQQLWLHSVNEITYQDLSYPNMILIGIRALATNQLSGANINITADITYGLRTVDNNIMPAALQAYEEDNPACVAADMMLDDLYGGGAGLQIKPVNIERFIDEWLAWAENSDTLVPDGNGLDIRLARFNGIFDNEANLWEQVQSVGRMSRAAVIPMGRDYGVYVDQVDVPVQMFSVGNIKQDSFEETWLALDDRANQVEVEFPDATRSYRADNPLVYMAPEDQAAGVQVKNVRVRGTGITSPAQAWHYAHFMGACNKLLLRTGKFECDVDAIACRPGQLVILQHDVPQWGWGGRTLPGSGAAVINVDRNDLPWDGSTAYNLIALYPSVQRYAGTVSAASASIDSTGLNIGTLVTLSSFDNLNRVTRAVINGIDCAILKSAAGQILVTPPPGFTPAVGQAYTLYDTDVMQTAAVSGVAAGPGNTQVITLGTPFTSAPADFSTYFYGQPGSQKIVRVTNIRRMSEERRVIEWIDYDPNAYTIGTPVVGETSAINTTDPQVRDLTAMELFDLRGGTYVDEVQLAWTPGPNTIGVTIFGQYPGMTQPKLLARLTGVTTWKMQVAKGVAWSFTVVGFDTDDNYAGFATAPVVSFTAVGITGNMLQDSSFQSGFTQWNVTPRAADSLVPSFQNDGEAVYTVGGAGGLATSITATQPILNQVIPGQPAAGTGGSTSRYHVPSLYSTVGSIAGGVLSGGGWSIGQRLMLSAYFEVTGGTPTGNLIADIAFFNSTGAIISTAPATLALAAAGQTLIRVHSSAVQVPTGTADVRVRVFIDGSTINFPISTVIKISHLLLESATSGQTVPSVWADVDGNGKVIDVFQIGSSASMRAQGSTLPTYTGSFPFTYTDTTITLAWAGLQINWPDTGSTEIMDGSIPTISGLTAGTSYWVYLYFDIVNGGIHAVPPTTPVGTSILSATQDFLADAACHLDGRIPLTPGGLLILTAPAGGSGSGAGAGTGGGAINVQVTPGSGNIGYPSGTTTFSATVTPGGGGVTWSATNGSINSTGTLTGPGGSAPHGGGSVVATSVAHPSVSGGASFYW